MNVEGSTKKVFVGLSGGVDSSVAALRLKKAGYDVTGVFIKVWHPDFLVCDWERERLDAMRVAAILEIPFLTFDAEEAYKRDVADYMIAEYQAGRTPNPDVMCNKYVKFGAFLEFALANGADYVATGHYAQIKETDGSLGLYRGVDTNKDQSYFLWTIKKEQLKHILFPIGDSQKDDIRKEAEKAGLPTAKKHDSQGICFLGKIDLKEFLSHYIQAKQGNVLDVEGNVIGTHDGALFLTLGQRHGFTLSSSGEKERAPLYVVGKDMERNTITVAEEVSTVDSKEVRLSAVNQITDFKDEEGLCAQFRYRQKPFEITLESVAGGVAVIVPETQTENPSEGQSAVIYRGEECLGGGIITH